MRLRLLVRACVHGSIRKKTHRTGQEFYQEKADALELAKH